MIRHCTAAAFLALAVPAAAQTAENATFYMVIGSDTISVERMTRLPNHLESRFYDLKRLGRFEFTAELRTSGLVETFGVAFFTSDRDTTPIQQATVQFSGDSAGFTSSGKTNWLHLGPNAIPNVNPSAALMEQALIRAKSMGGDRVNLSFIYLPGGPEVPVTVAWMGKDSALMQFAGVTMRFLVSPIGRLLGGVIPSQGVQIVRGTATSGRAPGRKSYEAPPGAPYTAQEVTVRTKGGLSLAGTLTLPSGATGPVPAVLTITGSGPQDRDEGIAGLPKYALYRQIADTLGRRGIAVLRLDDRGVGGSDRGPLTATTLDFADDIRAAVDYLRTRREIDPRRIALVGHSEGGIIAPMVAASDSGIAAIVLLAGSVSKGREILEFQQRYVVDSMAHLLGDRRTAALAQYAHNTDSVAAAVPWMKFFVDYDGTATARQVRVPTLILQGARDYQVPSSEAAKLAAAIRAGGNTDVTVRVFPATNHLFVDDAGVGFSYEKLPSFDVRPEVLGTLSEWLARKLRR